MSVLQWIKGFPHQMPEYTIAVGRKKMKWDNKTLYAYFEIYYYNRHCHIKGEPQCVFPDAYEKMGIEYLAGTQISIASIEDNETAEAFYKRHVQLCLTKMVALPAENPNVTQDEFEEIEKMYEKHLDGEGEEDEEEEDYDILMENTESLEFNGCSSRPASEEEMLKILEFEFAREVLERTITDEAEKDSYIRLRFEEMKMFSRVIEFKNQDLSLLYYIRQSIVNKAGSSDNYLGISSHYYLFRGNVILDLEEDMGGEKLIQL